MQGPIGPRRVRSFLPPTAMLLLSLLLALAGQPGAAPVPQPASASLQEEGEVADRRPEVAELLATFEGHAGARGKEDGEAIAVIDQLLQEWPRSGPKDRAAILKSLGKAMNETRRELEDGVPDNKLFIAVATALGEMGVEASKELQKWVGNKKHRKDLALQRRLVLSLGKTRDPKAVKPLLDLLNDKDNIIVAAACQALAEYEEADQDLRKKAFNELLKLLMTTKALTADPNDLVARARYDAIAAPIITTLQKLSGHDERKPEEWQRWWNKNKKADWDAED